MKFDVGEVVNGFTVKVGENEELHVAKNAKDVAKIVTMALGAATALGAAQPPKVKKLRKPRKKAAVAAANSDALAGLNP